jgi:hypothetical protein
MDSSVNAHPTRYFILSDQKAKDDLAKLLDRFKDNKPKILSESHVIVYAVMEYNLILTLNKIMLKGTIDQY